jgi:hypothetical protein
MERRHLRPILILLLALACLMTAGTGSALARFVVSASVGGNTFTAGTWAYYLHNNPTPPVGNTRAQIDLPMNATVPTAATLFRYSTNCAAQPGRRLQRAAPSPTQATVCRYVNWRTAALGTALRLSGAITVDIWSATDNNNHGRTGGIVAYLRDYNGATYTEIANGSYWQTYAVTRTFYHLPITVTVTTPYTLAVGHQLELKLVATNAYQSNMLVAYDTTTYPSFLRVR